MTLHGPKIYWGLLFKEFKENSSAFYLTLALYPFWTLPVARQLLETQQCRPTSLAGQVRLSHRIARQGPGQFGGTTGAQLPRFV